MVKSTIGKNTLATSPPPPITCQTHHARDEGTVAHGMDHVVTDCTGQDRNYVWQGSVQELHQRYHQVRERVIRTSAEPVKGDMAAHIETRAARASPLHMASP